MQAKTLQALEFDKILGRLAQYAVSEAGARACTQIAPATCIAEIQEKNDFFRQGECFVVQSGFRLSNFPDLTEVLRLVQVMGALLDADALWAIRQVLLQAYELAGAVEKGRNIVEWPLLASMVQRAGKPEKSLAGVVRCLADNGGLRDESSPGLQAVRDELRCIHQLCTKKVTEFISNDNLAHYVQDSFLTLSSDRYVLPLKSNFKGRVQGIIHDYSQTGETCYVEPVFLVELNNNLQELKQRELEEERKIFLYLTELIHSEFREINASWHLLVEVDMLQARCALAAAYDGMAVDFDSGRPFCLRGARHPLLALAGQQAQALDLELQASQACLLISGGNAGGKTVCLKTVGLIALMAAAGLPVPVAEGSTLPDWQTVYAFIGDDQSLEGHVSTFTAQIQQLSRIWGRIDSHTLVILDEFGAGTDPAQGAALAQGVLDELLAKGATVCAATHFPALKAYALSQQGIRAASVLFDPATKRPLYRLAYDQVGASLALDVAREYGLPESVLKRAENYLLLDGKDSTLLLDRLNDLAASRERELESLDREKARLRLKRENLEARFAKERQALFDAMQSQAQEILHAWKQGKRGHKQALKELSTTRRQLMAGGDKQQTKDAVPTMDSLHAGMAVYYLPWGKNVIIEDIDARRNRLKVTLRGVSMWIPAGEIAFVTKTGGSTAKEMPWQVEKKSALVPSVGPPMRVDIRGLRAEVAISELAVTLDRALLAGTRELEVIHGRGTGVLRKEVHAFLNDYVAAVSFTIAPEDRGGDGMTIVELA